MTIRPPSVAPTEAAESPTMNRRASGMRTDRDDRSWQMLRRPTGVARVAACLLGVTVLGAGCAVIDGPPTHRFYNPTDATFIIQTWLDTGVRGYAITVPPQTVGEVAVSAVGYAELRIDLFTETCDPLASILAPVADAEFVLEGGMVVPSSFREIPTGLRSSGRGSLSPGFCEMP